MSTRLLRSLRHAATVLAILILLLLTSGIIRAQSPDRPVVDFAARYFDVP